MSEKEKPKLFHYYYAEGYKHSQNESRIKVSVKVEIKEVLPKGVMALTKRTDIPNGQNKEVFLPFSTVTFKPINNQ